MFFLFEDSEVKFTHHGELRPLFQEIRRSMNQYFDGSIKSDFLYGYMLMVNLNVSKWNRLKQ